ncbi:MAG: MmgE/PrpD family protein, partial [Thermodesulfobacteriota bacterium]
MNNVNKDYLSDIAKWVSELEPDHIPDKVMEIAECQLKQLKDNVFETAKLLEPGITKTPAFYSYANLRRRVMERMKFDLDDMLFMAHSSHSAVLVSLAEAHYQKTKKGNTIADEELHAAIVVGNEVSGRIAAACVFGRQNGQAWTFCHLLSTVASVSYLRGYDAKKIRKILGIAFAQPHFSLFPGFFSYAKPVAAWLPINTALEAIKLVELADTGDEADVLTKLLPDVAVKDAPELITSKRGFLDNFTFLGAAFFLGGLGDTWVTKALHVKSHPGCAYIETIIDHINEIKIKYPNINIDKIKKIKVR